MDWESKTHTDRKILYPLRHALLLEVSNYDETKSDYGSGLGASYSRPKEDFAIHSKYWQHWVDNLAPMCIALAIKLVPL